MRTSGRGRRVSTVCACVFLACAGSVAASAHANVPSTRARAAASSEPICCFTLSIYAEEDLSLVIAPSKSGGVVNPAGSYSYTLKGTAYGLAARDFAHEMQHQPQSDR